MDLANETAIAVAMARAVLHYRDLTLATVVCKASFDVSPNGEVVLSGEQLPVSDADAETPLGAIDGDLVPIKHGCDLAVMGHAHGPGGRPVRRMTVDMELGAWRRRVEVFGDRRWERTPSGLVPSAPATFAAMPLVYSRAYGGPTSAGDLETAYSDNPDGIGHVLHEEDVEGRPLPNVEETDQLVHSWRDQPLPAGVAPLPRSSSIRSLRSVDVDVENGTASAKPAMFSWSHPRMNVGRYASGTPFRVDGMTPEGTWRLRMPAWSGWLEVELGDNRAVLPLEVDTICIFPEYRRLFIVARRAFVYQVVPQRLRVARVRWDAMPEPTPLSTIAALRVAASSSIPLEPATTDSPIPFDLMREIYPLTALVEGLPLVPSS